jgi:hypothetical protein
VPSSFGWVVLDDQHKRDVMETLALSREQSTVDELGLGSVRDTLSNILFPGTSVLHTRAKYLLFVPWIYDGLRREGRNGRAAIDLGRRREIDLIDALLANDPAAPGIIGRSARGKLRRLPSAAYWAALGTFRIRRWDVSVEGYCNALRHSAKPSLRRAADEDGSQPATDGPWTDLPAPEDLRETTSITLTVDHASYLQGRIEVGAPGSMLLWLLDRGPKEATAPWLHPDLATLNREMHEALHHARWFASVTHGAVVLYNLMVAELVGDQELIDDYRAAAAEWRSNYDRDFPDGWPTDEFWHCILSANPRVHERTRTFLASWFRLVERDQAGPDGRAARQLVQAREVQLKRGLARLTNARARENWSGGSGMAPLNYRWASVSSLTRDIHEGLTAGAVDADS